MTIFDELRDVAAELFAELATDATLVRVARTYDEDDMATTETVARHAGRGALIAPEPTRGADGALILGEQAILGELPAGISPQVGDVLEVGAASARISGVQTVRPDGAAILWRLMLESA